MVKRARLSLVATLVLLFARPSLAGDARFDLVGPRIDVRVTRDGQTLPIASVPNLRPGDRLWIHPDLPATQSVKYLLICVFLRGTTNPPPENWFTRIDTWDKHVREEGVFVTVPAEAQQALLFLAPETGGDFGTLKSAVMGRPGAFVRAQQDLNEAGFEQARIEKYLASIRRVPPGDPAELQKHSDLLARTLALKPNADCFKRPPDMQFTCLTQTGSQSVLDDGHGQSIVSALSNGPGSDFITQASYTQAFGAGTYSAYVGAVVDLIRIMGNLHTAQYQYIPAISFPQAEEMNLRLNTPPSFHNPKSVLVIALPAVQNEVPPPLRPADIHHVACLIEPAVTLPVEGAPLVFSTDFAHDLVLHLNTPAGAPAEPDIPLTADAYAGGLALQQAPQHHVPLRDPLELSAASTQSVTPVQLGTAAKPATPPVTQPEPVMLTGTIRGRWGFDPFTGPTVPLQQLPGTGWHIVSPPSDKPSDTTTSSLIAGHAAQLLLASTGTACVHTISARPFGRDADIPVSFKPEPPPKAGEAPQPNLLALTLPLEHDQVPGDLHLAIQQYDQPKPDELATRTFAEPAQVASIDVHAGDRSLLVRGQRLDEVARLNLGDLAFTRPPDTTAQTSSNALLLTLPANAPAPPTHNDDHLTAKVTLTDGRILSVPVIVSPARPVITLLRKSAEPIPGANIALQNADDLPLTSRLTFTLKSPQPFPRSGQVEIETLDGTLRTVLTLAPSGGLLLQDPHTVVATLEPLRSFGPSAFGPLHLRAIFPTSPERHETHAEKDEPAVTGDDESGPASDWLPLATLVRLPTLSQLQCPTDPTLSCTLTGNNLFLLEAVSADPAFADPVPVPDGYTGAALSLPHVSAGTIFLKLRDDPSAVDTATLAVPAPPASHAHNTHATKAAMPTPSATDAAPIPQKQESPASTAPGPPTPANPSR
jgi:hypothetical protein